MIKFFLSVLIIGTVSFGFSCKSKTVVKKLVSQNANLSSKSETKTIDGVMYNLPKTVVQATVPVKKVTKSPGDFAKFAPCFFSASELDGIVTEESQSFSIDPPTFSSKGIPDTSETYVIKTKGKYLETKSLFVEYGNGYVLQSGKSESKNETLPFIAKSIATAASVAAKVAPLPIKTNDEANKKLLGELREEYNCFEKLNSLGIAGANTLKDKVGRDMEEIIQPKTRKFSVPPKTPNEVDLYLNQEADRTEYQKALSVYKNLKDLEEQRDQLLQGGGKVVPPETLKLMLEKNQEAIDAHKAAFLGVKSKDTWAATFEFIPKTDNEYSDIYFSYSPKFGVCNNGFIKKKSIPIKAGFGFSEPDSAHPDKPKGCEATTKNEIVTLWVNVKTSTAPTYLNNVRDATNKAAQKDKSRGWFYRIPADTEVTLLKSTIPCEPLAGGVNFNCLLQSVSVDSANIKYTPASGVAAITKPNDNKQIALFEMPIAQLGVVASIPASTAGRSSNTEIALDPATGAMKNFKVSSSALIDSSILDDAGKAVNSAIDAADPLNRKKRELEELKTQNQINDEKKKLTNTNSNSNDNNQ